ncbi:MAG: hypothetical protein Kow0089_13110 [Desulfobulbaceae bacterium]
MSQMKEITLSPELSGELADIYRAIEAEYAAVANTIGLTCDNCPDNCCDSYFLHYTYCEWAYLWEGLHGLGAENLERVVARAREYVTESGRLQAAGEQPRLMCPLNEEGRCLLYTHRMMICRLHGIPAAMMRPDRQRLRFPGCFRCQEIVAEQWSREEDAPFMDRTRLLARVAALEGRLLEGRRHLYPKVRKTIAEMIVQGPPLVDKPFCER